MRIFGGLSRAVAEESGSFLPVTSQLLTVLLCCLLMFVPARLGFIIKEVSADDSSAKLIVRITVFLTALSGMITCLMS